MTVRRSRLHGKAPGDLDEESSTDVPDQQQLITDHAALILFAALVVGLVAGVLDYLAGSKPADAVLTGGGAFAAAIVLLNGLIS